MEVTFWGTRGSIPSPMGAGEVRSKVRAALGKAVESGLGPESDIDEFMDRSLPFSGRATYGANTSCIEIRDGKSFVLCDAGTGLRSFGNQVMGRPPAERPGEFHIFLSHLHWDHIQGFPFFVPGLIPGNRVIFYGCHPDLEKAFSAQHSFPFFPIEFHQLGAEIRFETLTPGREMEVQGFKVTPIRQNHPGASFGYRFERGDKTVVYSTDSEHKDESGDELSSFIAFFNDADLLIFDAQYTFVDACTSKENWGHSNNLIGVELAHEAGVKHLVLLHHDPNNTDGQLDQLLEDTRKLAELLADGEAVEVTVAWDGLVVRI